MSDPSDHVCKSANNHIRSHNKAMPNKSYVSRMQWVLFTLNKNVNHDQTHATYTIKNSLLDYYDREGIYCRSH